MENQATINNGQRYKDGDILDARSLNTIIDEVVTSSELWSIFLGEDLIKLMVEGLESKTFMQGSTGNIQTITLTKGIIPFRVDITSSDYLSINQSAEGGYPVVITITESDALKARRGEVDQTFEYLLTVKLADDTLLTERSGQISYHYLPTEPSVD